jgi:hypothetical protein
MALVNGYFYGEIPTCLAILNRTEESMVGLINTVAKISLLPGGGHYASQATVFNVVNKRFSVIDMLPSVPKKDEFAFIRSDSTNKYSSSFKYSPYKVYQALLWLEENNHLYQGKVHLAKASVPPICKEDSVVPNDVWFDESCEELEIGTIKVSNEEMQTINKDALSFVEKDEGHVTNSGAVGESDVLLDSGEDNASSIVSVLQRTLYGADYDGLTDIKLTERDNLINFVSEYTYDFFFQSAFPTLYPYGRGGPTIARKTCIERGADFSIKLCDAYVAHTLKLGNHVN